MNLPLSWDYFLLILGNPGRYQILIVFLLCFVQIPLTLVAQLWKFYSAVPPHRCYIPIAKRSGVSANDWIPQKTDSFGGTVYSSCEMFVDAYNIRRGTTKCLHGWEFKPFYDEHNIIMEWNLVCDSKDLPIFLYYAFNLAAIAGSIGSAMFADRFGRKSVLLFNFYLFVPIVFAIHFIKDLQYFSIFFALQGLFMAGAQVCSYILLIEMLPKMYQFKASLLAGVASIFGFMILPMIVWGIQSWRYIQLAVSAPGIVLFAGLWILPESPLWTVSEGKSLEAEKLFKKLCQRNGKSLPSNLKEYLEAAISYFNKIGITVKNHGLSGKLQPSWLRWCLASNLYLSFVTNLSIDILDYQIFQFHETKYIDYFYRGLMDLGTITIIYFLVMRFGSRSLQAMIFLLGGFLMILGISFQESLPMLTEYDWFDFRLLLFPSTCYRGAEAIVKVLPTFVWFHSLKTLSTEIRVTGFSLIYSIGIIGKLAAPNLSTLGETMNSSVPMGLCGILCLIAGCISFRFPKDCETMTLVGPIVAVPIITHKKSQTESIGTMKMEQNIQSYDQSLVRHDTNQIANTCTKIALTGNSVDNMKDVTVSKVGQESHGTTAPVRPSTVYNTDDVESNLSDLEEIFGSDNWRLSSATPGFGQLNSISYLSFCNQRSLERHIGTEPLTMDLPSDDPNSLFGVIELDSKRYSSNQSGIKI